MPTETLYDNDKENAVYGKSEYFGASALGSSHGYSRPKQAYMTDCFMLPSDFLLPA